MRKLTIFIILFIYSHFAESEVKMCNSIFKSSLDEKVIYEIANRNLSEKVLRVDLEYIESNEIDSYKETNLENQNFAGIIFKYRKNYNLAENVIKSNQLIEVTDITEKEMLHRNTMIEAHSDRMSFVSKEEQFKSENENPKLSKSGVVYKYIDKHGVLKGLICLADITYLNEPVRLLTWVWKAKDILADDNSNFNFQVIQVLNASEKPIISSVQKQNFRSFNFHRRIGFKEKWLIFLF